MMKTVTRSVIVLLVLLTTVSFADVISIQSYVASPAAWSGDADTNGVELTDGILPEYDLYNSGWSSYNLASQDLEIVFEFSNSSDLNSIELYYVNYSPWSVVPPSSITCSFSTDGINFTDTVVKDSGFVATNGVAIAEVNTPGVTCSYVKVVISASAWVKLGELTFNASNLSFREISEVEYRDKMMGGWVGQMVGVSWGYPTEFAYCGVIMPSAGVPEWEPQMINDAFTQDDLYVEMTFLRTLELYGLDVPIRQAGIDFANSEYGLCHANNAGRHNLRDGIAPPDCSHPRFNKHADDIDYQIEADFSGLMAPGMPQYPIEAGEKFGRLVCYGDGLYGGQFIGAMYAEAFFENDMEKVVEKALGYIPSESQYFECIRDVLEAYRSDPIDWQMAWHIVDDKYQKLAKYRQFSCEVQNGFNIDAKINGAYVAIGLLYGESDFNKTIEIAMRCGQDSDCNPSNAAGILATSIGYNAMLDQYKQIDRQRKFYSTEYSFDQLIDVCTQLARNLIVRSGGEIVNTSGVEIFRMPRQRPIIGPLEQSFSPGPVEGSGFTEEEMEDIIFKNLVENERMPTDADVISIQSYVASPAAWYGDADTGGIELTDGVLPEYDLYNSGWSSYNLASQDLEIVFEFSNSSVLKSIELYYVNYSPWGIVAPSSITCSFSTDGVNFTDAVVKDSGFITADGFTTAKLNAPGVTCSYVKVVISASGWVKLGELTFNAPAPNPISYTTSPDAYSGTPDTSGKELVDGELPTNLDSDGWVGYNVAESNLVITFDMKALHTLSSVCVHYMANSGCSLEGPNSVTFTFSNDGVNFGNPVTYSSFDSSTGVHTAYIDVLGPNSAGRYVKAEMTTGPGGWLRLGEIRFADKGDVVYTAVPAANYTAPDDGGELLNGLAPIGDICGANWSDYYVPDSNLVVTFNLNESVELSAIKLFYMVHQGWNMNAPNSVTYSFSNDGVSFTNPVTFTGLDNSNWEHTETTNIPGGITAKYVRAELVPNGNWIRLSEFTFVKSGEISTPDSGKISYTTSVPPYWFTPDNYNNLANGVLPTDVYDPDWCGYGTQTLEVNFNLNGTFTLSSVDLRYHVYSGWNQKKPSNVQLTFSTDGVNFGNPVNWSVFDGNDGAHTTRINIPNITCQYVKAVLTSPADAPYHRLGEFLFCESGVDYNNAPKVKVAGLVSYDNPYDLLAVFDHPVTAASAQNTENYNLSGNVIAGAELWDNTSNCVKISLAIPLESGESYRLQYRNIEGTGGAKYVFWFMTNSFAPTSIAEEAQKILTKQLPDGAYNMTSPLNGTSFQPGDNNILIEPSFACLAAQAMMMANEVEPNSNYLLSVNNFLHWYANHLNANGTIYVYNGNYPNYSSSGHYDSTDAYAAQFIDTAYVYYKTTSDAAFLDWVWPYIIKVAGAIDLTLQSDGLTWATPTYLVKYLMDNSEVYIGYKTAAELAAFKSDTVRNANWSTKAANCLAGIEGMYLGDGNSRYASDKNAAGVLNTLWTDVYPHGDAQMTVLHNVLAENNIGRVDKVWNASVQKFIPNHVPNENLISVWWVLGGIDAGQGDEIDTAVCFASLQKGNGSWVNYLLPDYQNIMVMHRRIVQQRMGDLNIDGRVNFEDFARYSEDWNGSGFEGLANLANNWLQIDVWWK